MTLISDHVSDTLALRPIARPPQCGGSKRLVPLAHVCGNFFSVMKKSASSPPEVIPPSSVPAPPPAPFSPPPSSQVGFARSHLGFSRIFFPQSRATPREWVLSWQSSLHAAPRTPRLSSPLWESTTRLRKNTARCRVSLSPLGEGRGEGLPFSTTGLVILYQCPVIYLAPFQNYLGNSERPRSVPKTPPGTEVQNYTMFHTVSPPMSPDERPWGALILKPDPVETSSEAPAITDFRGFIVESRVKLGR